jgi:hypothetical protein
MQGTNYSKSLFIIPKLDLHTDIQLLKVRNEQKSLGFTVGRGQMIRLINLKRKELVFGRSKDSNRTDHILIERLF